MSGLHQLEVLLGKPLEALQLLLGMTTLHYMPQCRCTTYTDWVQVPLACAAVRHRKDSAAARCGCKQCAQSIRWHSHIQCAAVGAAAGAQTRLLMTLDTAWGT